MSRVFTFDSTLDRDSGEVPVVVSYSVTPFIEATHWQPAEGGEVEIISLESPLLMPPMSDDEERMLFEECQGRARDDLAAEADDYDDYRAERRA